MRFRGVTRGQVYLVVILGVFNGVYTFQPIFKELGEKQRAKLLKETEEINLQTRRIFNHRSSLMFKNKARPVIKLGIAVVIMITLFKNAGKYVAKERFAEDYANVVYESHMKSEIETIREVNTQERDF